MHRFIAAPPQSSSGGPAALLQQYSNTYTQRLGILRQRLISLAASKWPEVRTVDKIIDCEYNPEEDGVDGDGGVRECIIIGTLYKEMRLRPSVLDEFRDHNGMMNDVVQPILKYVSEDDPFLLEDESGRISLAGEYMASVRGALVTGIVPAVRGMVNKAGAFEVQDMLFAGDGLLPTSSATASEGFVLLVSGLSIGSGGSLLPLQLLSDYVCGRLPLAPDMVHPSKIVRVIIAGNTLSLAPAESSAKSDKTLVGLHAVTLKQADVALADLLTGCPVDLMPGPGDPATQSLPQQPLHPCLLPHANRFSTYLAATNPYEVQVSGRRLLGTAGQPVDDIVKHSLAGVEGGEGQAHVDALAGSLLWGHLAPTAPGERSIEHRNDTVG